MNTQQCYDEDESKNALIECLLDEPSIPHNNETITAKFDSKICGRVEYIPDNNGTFHLACLHCAIEFYIAEWENFVNHFKDDHLIELYQSGIVHKDVCDNAGEFTDVLAVEDDVFLIKEEFVDTTTTDNGMSGHQNCSNKTENPLSSNKKSQLKRKTTENTFDDTIEKRTRAGLTSLYNNEDDEGANIRMDFGSPETVEATTDGLGRNYSHTRSKKTKGRTSKKKKTNLGQLSLNDVLVKDFLTMVKDYPILWYGRHVGKKLFEDALTKVVESFNAKHNEDYTEEAIVISLTNIKHKFKQPNFSTKYSEYIEILMEIEKESKKITHNCDHCPRFFFNEMDLRLHKYKTHGIGESPFKCEICEYSFSSAEILAEHGKRHQIQKNVNCEICKKAFYEFTIEAHMKTHTQIVCEVCGEQFTLQGLYNKHLKKHQPHDLKCDMCEKTYYNKQFLNLHRKSHFRPTENRCEICSKTFTKPRGLRNHLRNIHKIIKSKPQYVWLKNDTIGGGGGDDNNKSNNESDGNEEEAEEEELQSLHTDDVQVNVINNELGNSIRTTDKDKNEEGGELEVGESLKHTNHFNLLPEISQSTSTHSSNPNKISNIKNLQNFSMLPAEILNTMYDDI